MGSHLESLTRQHQSLATLIYSYSLCSTIHENKLFISWNNHLLIAAMNADVDIQFLLPGQLTSYTLDWPMDIHVFSDLFSTDKTVISFPSVLRTFSWILSKALVKLPCHPFQHERKEFNFSLVFLWANGIYFQHYHLHMMPLQQPWSLLLLCPTWLDDLSK